MLELSQVTYAYPGSNRPAIDGLTLHLSSGERIALVGANGSGKSTVAALANGTLIASDGLVRVDGLCVGKARPNEIARLVGVVRQDPASQIVCPTVRDEVAFGPRCLDLPTDEVDKRVREALGICGLLDFTEREVRTLSSGQAQLLAIAGTLAMRPTYLILDEACAHLDPQASTTVMRLVDGLVAQGMGVLQITHDARELMGAHRIIELSRGVATWSGPTHEWLTQRSTSLHHATPRRMSLPSFLLNKPVVGNLTLDEVSVTLGGSALLTNVSVCVPAGTLSLVVGPSGSGKTTMARVAAGLLAPATGSVTLGGRAVVAGDVGVSFTRAASQLFAATVADDAAIAPRNAGMGDAQARMVATQAMSVAGVTPHVAVASPFAVSGGEQRRAALAGVIAGTPQAYVLDEPTAALDEQGAADVRALAAALAEGGAPVMVVTHDADAWLDLASNIVMLLDGKVVFSGSTDEYATYMKRRAKSVNTTPADASPRETDAHTSKTLATYRDEMAAPPVHSHRPSARGAPNATPHQHGTTVSHERDHFAHAFSERAAKGPAQRLMGRMLARIPAATKLIVCLLLTGVLFALDGMPIVMAFAIVMTLLCLVAGIGGVLTSLTRASVVMAFVLMGNAVVIGGTGDMTLAGPIALSVAGTLRGAIGALRIATLVMGAAIIARTTGAAAVGEALATPLRALPGGNSLALAVQVAITTVPQVGLLFMMTADAARTRGFTLDTGPRLIRLRAYGAVLTSTIVAMFLHARDMSTAMVARGYPDGVSKRRGKDQKGGDLDDGDHDPHRTRRDGR